MYQNEEEATATASADLVASKSRRTYIHKRKKICKVGPPLGLQGNMFGQKFFVSWRSFAFDIGQMLLYPCVHLAVDVNKRIEV